MQQGYILFRGHNIRNTGSGYHRDTHRGRGTDFGGIGSYVVGDDIRDISWSHSTRTNTIQKKIRMEEDNFPIVIVQNIDMSHGFYTYDNTMSAFAYAQKIQTTIDVSAKKYHLTTKNITKENIERERNAMIFYIISTIDAMDFRQLRGLAKYNDVIVLHIFHPYECDPQDDRYLFDGFSCEIKRYKEEFQKKQNEIKQFIHSLNIGYILMTTDMDIALEINQFFKNRFC